MAEDAPNGGGESSREKQQVLAHGVRLRPPFEGRQHNFLTRLFCL